MNPLKRKGGANATPYAAEATLDALTNLSPDVVHYKIARTLATIEIQDFASHYEWKTPTLSARPVVIYDAASPLPKYYEFAIFDDARTVGMVAAFAQTETASAVRIVAERPRDYSLYTSRALSSGRFVDVDYPSISYSRGAGLRAYSVSTDKPIDVPEFMTVDDYVAYLEGLDAESLAGMGIEDVGTAVANILAEREENERREDAFWSTVMANADAIMSVSDEELFAAFDEQKRLQMRAGTYENRKDEWILNQFAAISNYRWNGWCVPAELSWAHMGLMRNLYYYNAELKSNYNLRQVETRNFYRDDNDIIRGLDQAWIQRMSINSPIADGGLYYRYAQLVDVFSRGGPADMGKISSALSTMTGGKYKTVEYWGITGWVNDDTHKNIREWGLPVFSWRKAKSDKEKNEHFRTIFGSKYISRHWHESGKILGFIPYTLENYSTNRYWLIHDNGVDNKGFDTNNDGNNDYYNTYWENEMEGWNEGRSKYGVRLK